MSSLSHSRKVRSAMAALPIGTVSSSRRLVSTKPPTCCDRWRGKPSSSRGQVGGAADRRTGGIEAGLADVVVGKALAPAAPDSACQGGGDILGEAQRLADIADGAARPIVDHRGADRRAFPAVATVDVLHHLFAPLVFEIDVDVRRLVALARDEAGEEEVMVGLGRIDGGDAEAEADHRIGGRAAALAENALLPRPAHDVVHGEEVVGVVQLLDQRQLVAQRRGLTFSGTPAG